MPCCRRPKSEEYSVSIIKKEDYFKEFNKFTDLLSDGVYDDICKNIISPFEYLARLTTHNYNRFAIMENKLDECVAFALYQVDSDEMYIHLLCAATNGNRLGSTLLQLIECDGKSDGVKIVNLTPVETSIAFYKRNGYIVNENEMTKNLEGCIGGKRFTRRNATYKNTALSRKQRRKKMIKLHRL